MYAYALLTDDGDNWCSFSPLITATPPTFWLLAPPGIAFNTLLQP